MKKSTILITLFASIGSLMLLINCLPEESVTKKELCTKDIDVRRYGCNEGICYYVVTAENITFEYVVKATLKIKSTGESIVLTFNSSSLVASQYTSDGGVFIPFSIWNQNFGYTTSRPTSTASGVHGQVTFYNTTFYEDPTFEIELKGDCSGNTKVIDAEDVSEGSVTFIPSSMAVSEASGGSDFLVYLYSNNPKESINVNIETSLGEFETLSLTKTSGTSNFFEGSLSTVLSDQKGNDNDGSLNIENGTTITVVYNDALDQDDNIVSISGTQTVTGDFAPTCSDGIQNGDEEGVDCGGSNCTACPTCSDGIQNGDETGIDCGGTNCEECATCSDGIQNGDETGVDCGGSNCDACASGSAVTFENTTYEITDASYLEYSANGKEYILFTISRYENSTQVFTMDIEIASSTTITSETYTFDDADFGVTGSIGLNNTPDYATVNGGSVVVAITPLGDYALDINLQTDKGSVTGSYTVPGF
jgi:hypothetical protein